MGKKILGYIFYLLGIFSVMSLFGNIMNFISGKAFGKTTIETVAVSMILLKQTIPYKGIY